MKNILWNILFRKANNFLIRALTLYMFIYFHLILYDSFVYLIFIENRHDIPMYPPLLYIEKIMLRKNLLYICIYVTIKNLIVKLFLFRVFEKRNDPTMKNLPSEISFFWFLFYLYLYLQMGDKWTCNENHLVYKYYTD